jgi:hypothetical protein
LIYRNTFRAGPSQIIEVKVLVDLSYLNLGERPVVWDISLYMINVAGVMDGNAIALANGFFRMKYSF